MKINWDFLFELTNRLVEIGKTNKELPPLHEVESFKHFFTKNGALKYSELDERDGKFTRREILTRYLLVSVVLDQGPDMIGVRELLKNVTTNLYRQEIRIFHRPLDFFKELGISIEELLSTHKSIKELRAEDWTKETNSSPEKYRLFFAQSMRGIVSTKQVLDYAVHRWGVPLCVPLLLEQLSDSPFKNSIQPLVDYIESYESAEIMAQQLKDNETYGLGSAIGDKACHLFAKWYVSSFNLVKRKKNDPGWTGISYELPLDSNAGRVLFRTGFLFELAPIEDYVKWNVIQMNKGKGKAHYVRVTNIRGRKVKNSLGDEKFFKDYTYIVRNHIKDAFRPRTMDIQRIPNLLLYEIYQQNPDPKYSIDNFDDGLIYIGTNYCYNHSEPRCEKCPLNDICRGYRHDRGLIENFTT